MKPFSTSENTMNGTLVIPKLMCIKFYRIFFKRTMQLWTKKSPQRMHAAGGTAGKTALAEGLKGFYSLQMRRDVFKLMRLRFIPDDFVVMMQ